MVLNGHRKQVFLHDHSYRSDYNGKVKVKSINADCGDSEMCCMIPLVSPSIAPGVNTFQVDCKELEKLFYIGAIYCCPKSDKCPDDAHIHSDPSFRPANLYESRQTWGLSG